MKKIFSIEWSDKDGIEWVNIENIENCLFTKGHINKTSGIEVKDITDKANRAIKGFRRMAIGVPYSVDAEKHYKENDTAKGFIIEWPNGKPRHIDKNLLMSRIFGAHYVDKKGVIIKEIIDKGSEPSEFNKMASTKYIHVNDVVDIVREMTESLAVIGSSHQAVKAVNRLLEKRHIGQRLDVNWKLVVVPAEVDLTITASVDSSKKE